MRPHNVEKLARLRMDLVVAQSTLQGLSMNHRSVVDQIRYGAPGEQLEMDKASRDALQRRMDQIRPGVDALAQVVASCTRFTKGDAP